MQPNSIDLKSNLKNAQEKITSLTEILGAIEEFVDSQFEDIESEARRNSLIESTGALVSLATRKICLPEDSPAGFLNSDYFESELNSSGTTVLDNTVFAQSLTAFIQEPLDKRTFSKSKLCNSFKNLLHQIQKKKSLQELIKDPLLVGWLNQLLNSKRLDYDERRKKKSIQELSNLTQWYTPKWVANILVEEVLGTCDISQRINRTFLDPACGAGHLLIPAYLKLIEQTDKSQKSIEQILKYQLYGLEIDSHVLRIAGLSIYLATRDIDRVSEFSIPNLYYFVGEGSAAGSYIMGAKSPVKSKVLNSLDNQIVTLQSIPEKFDAIAANPPYLSNRLIPKELKSYLKEHYPNSHYDLYTAFFELALKLLNSQGRTSFICQQSFLSIKRFEKLRMFLMNNYNLVTVAQLGKGVFATRSGEKVNSAIVTVGNYNESKHSNKVTVLSKEEQTLRKNIRPLSDIEHVFKSVPGHPLAVWCPNEIANLFQKTIPFESPESGIICTNGLFTCNNKKFVKHFSELQAKERASFVPYDKGGSKKWYYTTPYFLDWGENGEAIRKYRKERGQSVSLPGEDYYFKEGITYSYIGPSGFKARLLSPNSVFDIASSAIFSKQVSLFYLLGFLNSSLIRFILGVLNPTINFQIGDLRKIPYIEPDKNTKGRVIELSKAAIELAIQVEKYIDSSPAYDACQVRKLMPVINSGGLKFKIAQIEAKENEIQAEINSLIYRLYGISEELEKFIESDPWVKKDTFTQIRKVSSV